MRLKLILACRSNGTLSLNYHYALQAVIYKVLERADPVFSHWLHEHGYDATGHNFKLFTFSELRGTPFHINKERQTIQFQGNRVEWRVSFYVAEQVEKFVMGLFQQQRLKVITPDGRIDFDVQNVEILPKPTFSDTMRFRATMPICISEQTETDKQAQYRPPSHENFERLFFNNLKRKYQAANGFENTGLRIENAIPHPQLSTLKILNTPRMKGLTTIKRTMLRPTKTIGYIFDFEITAPVEWLQMGYYAGFGGKNSSGFGFCEVF